MIRQIPSTMSVNTIRDLSSGILKQLANVLRMVFSIAISLYGFLSSGPLGAFLGLGCLGAAGASPEGRASSPAVAGADVWAEARFREDRPAGDWGPPIISQVPPCPSIFSLADLLKACARTVSFFLRSPSPRILIPSLLPLARPALRMAVSSTNAPVSKLFRASRFTGK